MKENFFKSELLRAQEMQKYESSRADYWLGYQRGLRRRYHGEDFGTPEDNQLWLHADGDESRRQRSAGYRDGFYGPDALPQTIRKWRDWSVDELGERVGRAAKTIQGWEWKQPIPAAAVKLLERIRENT